MPEFTITIRGELDADLISVLFNRVSDVTFDPLGHTTCVLQVSKLTAAPFDSPPLGSRRGGVPLRG